MSEISELEKRLDWLDSERQKDKKTINELKDELKNLQEDIRNQHINIHNVDLAVKANAGLPSRIEQVDQQTSTIRPELLKKIMEIEKSILNEAKKAEKSREEEIGRIEKRFAELQAEIKPINELKKTLQSRVEEEFRIGQKVDSVVNVLPELRSADEELQRQITVRFSEVGQEAKRVTDVQLENSALRKRVDEIRNTNDLYQEAIRKLDKKIDELIGSEKERRQNQTAFLEKISLSQVDKDSQWKEWQQKYTELQSIGPVLNTQLLALDETHRSIKKTQAEFDEINEKLNRRINEITEMNRLAEERFRQEWITFKADDQKRWTNYTLAREEESREDSRILNQVNNRLTQLEDSVQDLKDSFSLITEETKKQLNGFYTTAQELVESFNQAFRKRL